MPRIIQDDGTIATVQNDSGQVFRVPSGHPSLAQITQRPDPSLENAMVQQTPVQPYSPAETQQVSVKPPVPFAPEVQGAPGAEPSPEFTSSTQRPLREQDQGEPRPNVEALPQNSKRDAGSYTSNDKLSDAQKSEGPQIRDEDRSSANIQQRTEGTYDLLGKSYQREGEAESKGAQNRAKVLEDYQKDADTEYQSYKEREARIKENMDAKQDRVEALSGELDKWSLDPKRFWKKQSTAEKAGILISAAVAGIGDAFIMASQALAGGSPQKQENNVLNMLDKEFERDIDAQKMEYDKLGRRLDNARSLYEMAHRELGDEREAFNFSMAWKWGQAEKEFMRIGEETNSAVVKERSFQKAQEAEMAKNNYLERMKQQQIDNALKKEQTRIGWYNAQTQRMELDARKKEREDKAKADAAAKNEENIRKFGITYVGKDGQRRVVGMGRTEDEAKTANAIIQGRQQVIALRPELAKLTEQGATWTPSERKAKVRSFNKNLVLARKRQAGDMSAVNDGDWAAWGIDPERLYSSDELEALIQSDALVGDAMLEQMGVPVSARENMGFRNPENFVEGSPRPNSSASESPGALVREGITQVRSVTGIGAPTGYVPVYQEDTGQVHFVSPKTREQLMSTMPDRFRDATPKEVDERRKGLIKKAEEDRAAQEAADNAASSLN